MSCNTIFVIFKSKGGKFSRVLGEFNVIQITICCVRRDAKIIKVVFPSRRSILDKKNTIKNLIPAEEEMWVKRKGPLSLKGDDDISPNDR